MTDTDPTGLRVREALTRVADEAPPPVGLAAAARGRARSRHRSRVAVAAGVAVAAAVVPVALLLDGGPGTRATDPAAPSTSRAPEAADGWRVVTWKDLTVQVPEDWAVGGRTDWCAGSGRPTTPVVQVPGTAVQMISCDPHYSYGVTMGPGSAYDAAYPSGHVWRYERGDVVMYVEGSWLGHWYDGERLVQVNAQDRALVERILGTVRVEPWTTVEHDGVTVELPPTWAELDTSGCEFSFPRYGPPDRDPCGDGPGLALSPSATFDTAHLPDELRRDERSGAWGAYTYAGDYAVWVTDFSRRVVERVLASARPAG